MQICMMKVRTDISVSHADGSNRSNKSCLAKVSSVHTVKGECTLVCRIFPLHIHEIVSSLRPATIWEGLNIFSLTTVAREYTAITELPMLSLSSEILRPNFRKYRPDEKTVTDTMNKYKANRPQAEAIVSAVQQKTGFVLIQGPRMIFPNFTLI